MSFESRNQAQSRLNSRFSHCSSHHTDQRSISSRGHESSNASRGRTGYRGTSRTSHTSGADICSTPQLTDKEKADWLAAGQCFVCGGSDHFS